MNTLKITAETFATIISGLIKSGVTFTAVETKSGIIEVTFTGGY